jgi:Fe2+ or Zn2+ uptake regulation protein
MTSPLNEFRQHLAASGKRLTTEREIVAATIFSLHSPFTAETILEAIGKDARVSRATVYRTLSMLAESGQIKAKPRSDSELLYSHSYQSPAPAEKLSHLCKAKHLSLIAGKCPWCGGNIINGKPVDS